MHELSIAMRIVETVSEALPANEPGSVRAVQLRVGRFSTVVPDALHFAWDQATQNTRLERSQLQIELVEPQIDCIQCRQRFVLPGVRLRCPQCDQPANSLCRGRELEILSVELNECNESEPRLSGATT